MSKAKKVVRCACGGGKVQHTLDEDGCWCVRCLQKPRGERCAVWNPKEIEVKPVVNRNVAPVGHRHPTTSREAARKSLPRKGTKREKVYRLIALSGDKGMTDDELEQAIGGSHQSVSATRNTLMNDEMIVDSGLKRRTQWGNAAIAWKVAP